MKDKPVLAVRDISLLLDLSKTTTLKGLREGSIPGAKICGQWRSSRAAILEMLRGGRGQGGAEHKQAA